MPARSRCAAARPLRREDVPWDGFDYTCPPTYIGTQGHFPENLLALGLLLHQPVDAFISELLGLVTAADPIVRRGLRPGPSAGAGGPVRPLDPFPTAPLLSAPAENDWARRPRRSAPTTHPQEAPCSPG